MNIREMKRTLSVLNKWAAKALNAYKNKLAAVRASGALQDNATFEVRQNESSFEVVFNLLSYWKYIENGRLPGSFPPVNAIMDWIRIKPIVPQPIILQSGKQVVPTENQIAFLVGRKIARDGIEAKHLLEETLEQWRLGLINDLKKAISEDIRDQLLIEFSR